MVSKKSRQEVRMNKHRRLRNRFSGTPERTDTLAQALVKQVRFRRQSARAKKPL